MEMVCISDNINTTTGMRLAGVEGLVVHEKAEVKAALEKAVANKENGIILLTEKLAKDFPEIISNIRLKNQETLLVEIPDRHGTGRRSDFITSYINEAIGVKI
ncbi:MAG: V-type ATP synthase subunit F [Alkalibacterium gilvum]|uniref:V/A-type H+-transporting ATPase subunit F n=1 Tax=Alkalibacterium gilvum TaxID=1130080 RepID=A0A1H6UT06_9LACT|nr:MULTISPECIES: V-type ATP synthase subunit F [Alkalibacterium]MDN6193675.1 V-type ATP synthase subunit F [Alkalibacterium sp.]MDN6295529.1 V-type ATP synthase subunit F [Alkalibacterium sp.]MDN6729817.1 V-type ATP synthase subunit F [Alkalibacterium sp.]SEI95553.1 V/A-type H+-transporting ATPase subunit F [Alkalibacterium gilvum]HAJ70255.1 ATP synthase subunit F [Alkalibacterium sp.]